MTEKSAGALYSWDKQNAVLQSTNEPSQVAKCVDVQRVQGHRWSQESYRGWAFKGNGEQI